MIQEKKRHFHCVIFIGSWACPGGSASLRRRVGRSAARYARPPHDGGFDTPFDKLRATQPPSLRWLASQLLHALTL